MKTSKRSLVIVAAIAAMSCMAAYIFLSHDRANDRLKVELLPFERADKRGWGYEIKVDHQTFIRQETIPAVAGDRAFHSREDAVKTGSLALRKLLKGKLPALSLAEVQSLGIVKSD